MTDKVFLFKKTACTFLFLAVTCFVSVCTAADYRTLVVSKTDGGSLRFTLTAKLKLSFSDECLQVRDEAVNVDVPRSVLAAFSFSEEESGVEQAVADNGLLTPAMTKAGVEFCNLAGPVVAKIYSVDGKLLKTCEVNDGTLLPYSDFSSGINIVEIEGVAFKIYVK